MPDTVFLIVRPVPLPSNRPRLEVWRQNDCDGYKVEVVIDNARNNGISQSDMYQMYAYSKKYEADGIKLLYPYSDTVTRTGIRYESEDNVKVDVNFIDLKDSDGSIV